MNAYTTDMCSVGSWNEREEKGKDCTVSVAVNSIELLVVLHFYTRLHTEQRKHVLLLLP